MADIEQELKGYMAGRAGGRSKHAARKVEQAAQCYRRAVEALQRSGNASQELWVMIDVSFGVVV